MEMFGGSFSFEWFTPLDYALVGSNPSASGSFTRSMRIVVLLPRGPAALVSDELLLVNDLLWKEIIAGLNYFCRIFPGNAPVSPSV